MIKISSGFILRRGKKGTFECDYILCVPKPKLLARWLGIGERSVQLYLKALVDAGIVIELGKRGPRGKRVFASGFFRPLPVGIAATKREYFLKDTPEWREVLCRLKV